MIVVGHHLDDVIEIIVYDGYKRNSTQVRIRYTLSLAMQYNRTNGNSVTADITMQVTQMDCQQVLSQLQIQSQLEFIQ